MDRLGGASLTATDLAEALVGFANAAGGADNVTVAVARLRNPAPAAGTTTDPPPPGERPTERGP